MIAMAQFSNGTKLVELPVQQDADLRSLQEELCRLFGKPFPKMTATVRVNGESFDDFQDTPFRALDPGSLVEVGFEQTTDPYFYDLIDRTQRPGTIEEEILWETERAGGTTLLAFKDWLTERKRPSISLATPMAAFPLTTPDVVDVAFLPPWEEIKRPARRNASRRRRVAKAG